MVCNVTKCLTVVSLEIVVVFIVVSHVLLTSVFQTKEIG